MPTPTRTKQCTTCGRTLPLTQFHRRRHYVRSGLRAACKDCTRDATHRARAEQPSRADLHKQRIRSRTHEAIRRGELTPQPCRVCGAIDDVEAHHRDYAAPDAHLQVEWLCEKHHALEHGTRPWTKQAELFPAMT